MRQALILIVAMIATDAAASEITFETAFSVTDSITGLANGLNADDNLSILVDNRRVGPVSLPRFDPNLGQLDTVSLAVAFEGIDVDIPISFSGADGQPTTASIDEASLEQGFVVAVQTGFIRPFVIANDLRSFELDDLTNSGFLTTDVSSAEITIPIDVDGFPFDSSREASPFMVEGPASFSFTGTEDFEFVVRTVNELTLGFDQDNLNVEVLDGINELSGVVSVTYGFTPLDELDELDMLDEPNVLDEIVFDDPLDDPNSIESRLAELEALREFINELRDRIFRDEADAPDYVLFRDSLSALPASNAVQPFVGPAVAVPEPQAVTMLLLAFAGAAGCRRPR